MNKEQQQHLKEIQEIAEKAFKVARKEAEKIAKVTDTQLITPKTIELLNR